jgi:O-antigen ligase
MESRGRPFKWSVAHNSYLETAAEAGAVALVCFLGMFMSTLVCLRRVTGAMGRLRHVARELALAQVLIASLVGYMICAFFLSAEYFAYPYVLIGMSLGLVKVTRQAAQPTI